MSLAQSWFGQFMASGAGRATRFVAGLALILAGAILGDAAGITLIVIGFVPLGAAVFDVCLISALFGGPLSGERIRGLAGR